MPATAFPSRCHLLASESFLMASPAVSKVFSFTSRWLHPYCGAWARRGNRPSPDIPPTGCLFHLHAFSPGCTVAFLSHAWPEIKGKSSEMAKELGVNTTNQLIKQPCSAEMIFPGLQATWEHQEGKRAAGVHYSFCLLAALLVAFNSAAPAGADAPFSEARRSRVWGGQRMQTENPGLPDVGVPC